MSDMSINIDNSKDLSKDELQKKIYKLQETNSRLENELSFIKSLSDNFMEKLSAIMNNSEHSIILFFDMDFELAYLNLGFSGLLGYAEDKFDSDIHSHNLSVFNKLKLKFTRKKSLKGVSAFTEEVELLTIKNKLVNFRFNISEIVSLDGIDNGHLYFGYDVTLEKKMKLKLQKRNNQLLLKNKKIEEANRYKTQFLNNITHELRTPLSGIIGVLSLIDRLKIDNEKLNDNLKIIGSNSKNLLEIINQLLDISRIEAGRMTTSYSKTPLLMVVYDADNLAKSLLNSKPEVKFKAIFDKSDTKRMIYIDNSKLRQIIINLIGNAIKFTKKGTVTLDVKVKNENRLIISILDTGIGIKKDDLKKIFQPFVQADGSITTAYGGTGLGLAITQKLVKLLNGTMKVKSTFNCGTEFILNFKLKKSNK